MKIRLDYATNSSSVCYIVINVSNKLLNQQILEDAKTMKAYDLSMKHGISDQEALAFISASSEGSLVVNAGVDEHCPHSNFGIVTDGDGYYNG